MLKNVNSLKLIKLKFVFCCFLPYLCVIIKGGNKIPYLLTKTKTKKHGNKNNKQTGKV